MTQTNAINAVDFLECYSNRINDKYKLPDYLLSPTQLNEYRFGEHDEYNVVICNNRELRETAFRLVYNQYSSKGYNLKIGLESEMWFTTHAFHPQTITYMVERNEFPVAVLNVIPDSTLGLPSEYIFPERTTMIRSEGRKASEISSFVVLDSSDDSGIEIPLHLFKFVWLTAQYIHGATDMIATAMSRHTAFYGRVLLFDELSEDERKSPKTGEMVRYVRLRLDTACDKYKSRYDGLKGKKNLYRFFNDGNESRILDWIKRSHQPMSYDDIQYFGTNKSSFLTDNVTNLIYLLNNFKS